MFAFGAIVDAYSSEQNSFGNGYYVFSLVIFVKEMLMILNGNGFCLFRILVDFFYVIP